MSQYDVLLKRKPTTNAVQNIRQRRETVFAASEEEARHVALMTNHNHRYFVVERVVRK